MAKLPHKPYCGPEFGPIIGNVGVQRGNAASNRVALEPLSTGSIVSRDASSRT